MFRMYRTSAWMALVGMLLSASALAGPHELDVKLNDGKLPLPLIGPVEVGLLHGLDCSRSNWWAMSDLLSHEGYQVSYFTYPSDGPVEESVAMFTRQMRELRGNFPDMPVSIVAHSMGGLVARGYVEGGQY